jgi:type IV secretory pathway VirB6-like protein
VIPWNRDVILWNRDVISWNHVVILIFADHFLDFSGFLAMVVGLARSPTPKNSSASYTPTSHRTLKRNSR